MSGHSKWANIKYRKESADAKKGRLFSKLAKEISVAAREGGGDPETNPRLRQVIEKAKDANMPLDNIERAVKRGTGELPGVSYEQVLYEGYGPGGVAIMVEALTDNKNRTTSEIRNIFSKKGGNMAGAGSVSWLFHKKGYIMIDKNLIGEDKLFELMLEAGVEDLKTTDDIYEITTLPQDLEKVKQILKENNINWRSAEVTLVPTNYIKLDGEEAKRLLALMNALEDHDDVQNVYANFDIPDKIIEEMAEKS